MKKEVVIQLERVLKQMSLPDHRKTVNSGNAVKWLKKNLAVKNSEHPLYPIAVELIRKVY